MNKAKGHRKTASLGQGAPALNGDLGPEWTEEVDQVLVHMSNTIVFVC